MLIRELLILAAILVSVNSQTIPENCTWSENDCEELQTSKDFPINCDKRHDNNGGTVYSCKEACSIPDNFFCSYDYCIGYRSWCLTSKSSTPMLTSTPPPSFPSALHSSITTERPNTIETPSPQEITSKSSGPTESLSIKIFTALRSSITTERPNTIETPSPQEITSKSSGPTESLSIKKFTLEIVLIVLLSLFCLIAIFLMIGFDKDKFSRRISRCLRCLWSPSKYNDQAASAENSDIERNQGSDNEAAERGMETGDSFAMAQQSAHSADKQNDIARLIGKISRDGSKRDYKQTLDEFLKVMDGKLKAEPAYWLTVYKHWMELKRSVDSRPSMHRQLSIEEPANIPSASQQTPREAAKDNSKEMATVEEKTQLLAGEPEETGIIDNQHAVIRIDAVDFTDIKLFDILVMVQWSTHHTDIHAFEMPYLHLP
ncbi:uncharacterized protein [Watersipora subatra]|uniref:uncharacterized protein n=1 Tax=Watersipora subatra TaxID=2589382 RepID=UPI00355B24EE